MWLGLLLMLGRRDGGVWLALREVVVGLKRSQVVVQTVVLAAGLSLLSAESMRVARWACREANWGASGSCASVPLCCISNSSVQ